MKANYKKAHGSYLSAKILVGFQIQRLAGHAGFYEPLVNQEEVRL